MTTENNTQEKVIDKIRKCLTLAGNNPSQEEAASAMLMAQRLMAKHGMTIADIDTEFVETEEIKIVKEEVGTGSAWKVRLALIIAENFRCKTFSYGRSTIAFYGYETDAEAAREVFKMLFKLGHKLGLRARTDRTKRGLSGDGIYNSFVLGFCEGIKSKLDEQSVALMIVMAPEVETEYKEFIKGAKSSRTSLNVKNGLNQSAYNTGIVEGRNAMGRKALNA